MHIKTANQIWFFWVARQNKQKRVWVVLVEKIAANEEISGIEGKR